MDSGALVVFTIVINVVEHIFARRPFPQAECLSVELLSEGVWAPARFLLHVCRLKLLYPFVIGIVGYMNHTGCY